MRFKILTALFALLLLAPVVSQESTEESKLLAQFYNPADTEALKLLGVKTTRLALAFAFLDPALVLQEIDTVEPYIKAAEGPAARYPALKIDLADFRNTVALMKLYPLTEFGLMDNFDSVAEPLIAKSKEPNHRIATLFLGLKGSFIQTDHVGSRHYLERVREEIAAASSRVSPVHRYSLASFEVMQKMAEGKVYSKEELESEFRSAWSHLDNYDPNQDWASAASWGNGRYASLFWIHQLSKHQSEDEIVGPTITAALTKWGTNPRLRSTGQFKEDLESVQGFIIFVLSNVETLLVLKEEYLSAAPDSGFVETTENFLESLERQTQQLQTQLALPGAPNLRLSESALLQELKLRFELLRCLHPSRNLQSRLESLDELATRVSALKLDEPYILNHLRLGKVFLLLDRPSRAVASWEKAYQKADQTGYRNLASEAARLLTAELARQKEWEKAKFYATQVSEALKYEIASVDLEEMAVLAKEASTNEAKAYLNSSDPKNALVALDKGSQMKTAALKLSANPGARSAAKSLTEGEKKVSKLRQGVANLKQAPKSETRDQLLGEAETALAETRAEFLAQSRKIRAEFPDLYTSTLRFDPLDLAEVQRSLAPGIAVVQYFPTDSGLYIFVVDSQQFRLRTTKLTAQALDKKVDSFYRHLLRQSEGESQLAQELYQLLISPIASDIQEAKQLVFIPAGKLNTLPFAALMDESGKRLIEKRSLAELAKTTDFVRMAHTDISEIGGIVAFTNATQDLPATDEEGRKIVEMFPGSLHYRGTEASKSNLLAHAGDKDVLHLAAHGMRDPNDSLRSHLRLANGERLAQEEIFNLNLAKTSMVTLSACSTALGDSEVKGFVASLAEAFWIAGSPTVIASLWSVEDQSTGILMAEFYQGMKSGLGRAKALRSAQLKLIKSAKYTHPFYWSGFVTFGDYR